MPNENPTELDQALATIRELRDELNDLHRDNGKLRFELIKLKRRWAWVEASPDFMGMQAVRVTVNVNDIAFLSLSRATRQEAVKELFRSLCDQLSEYFRISLT
jgi:hypothetical protein